VIAHYGLAAGNFARDMEPNDQRPTIDQLPFNALDYFATLSRARDTFLLNFGGDYRRFQSLVNTLHGCWARLGTQRDGTGHSHAGLVLFSNILMRHAVLGFQALASYQSFLAWLSVRPGLEALLIVGKFVDSRENARIWRERETDRDAYQRAFQGKALTPKSLEDGEVLRLVLTRLNDNFTHPNPNFVYRDQFYRDERLMVQFLETRPEIHEAHVLAYLNLVDRVVYASEQLVAKLLAGAMRTERTPYAKAEMERARRLADAEPLAKRIMVELGLWEFPEDSPKRHA